MKKITVLFAAATMAFSAGSAQDATVTELKKSAAATIKKDPKDTIPQKWKTGGGLGLNFNQGSLSNWSAGGDKFSLSLNAISNLYAFYKQDRHSWDNTLDLAYGMVKTTSLGRRKAADRFDLLSKYGYELAPKLSLSALGNFRTQFAPGYSYLKNRAGGDSAVLFSKSFAPAYALVSPGLDWKPTSSFSLFVSPVTARWIIVTDNRLKSFYSVPLSAKSRNELGAFASANLIKSFGTFNYKGRLDLFSNYRSNPENIDVFWTNAITAKLTRYINFTFNYDMIYDDDTKNVDPNKGPAPQILQLMGVGFAYTFKN